MGHLHSAYGPVVSLTQLAVNTLIDNLRAVVGAENVLSDPDELLVYECDGLPQHKYRPSAVVFPSTTEETSGVMRVLSRAGVSFTPRGAGTGLSGGALALDQGVVIELARMRKVLKVDGANRIAVVQTGVVNSHVSRAVASLGLHYVPDPSSQPTCTIGGNIAENAGGIHCLKYGTTTDHVLGLRVVLADGEIVHLGGSGSEKSGYDLLGTFIGSEGTFGIATEATLRLVPIPPTVRTLLAEFEDVNDASRAVSAIIAAGVMPAALEMMDREIIRAVEASVFAAGLSLDVGAALLIELDGIEAGLDDETQRVSDICIEYRARTCRSAQDEADRQRLWAARKSAFGAVSRISPDSMIQDAVVPRSRLPEVLAEAYRISAKYELRLANVFHAGDGNLHPLICFDSRWPEQVHRVKEAGRELMEACVRAGGSITGEHGVGFDKRELLPLIFSEADMEIQLSVRAAFDPTGLCNPGKIIPMLRGCGEARSQISPINLDGDNGAEPATPDYKAISPQIVSSQASRCAEFDPVTGSQRLSDLIPNQNVTAGSLPFFPHALRVTPENVDQACEVVKLAASAGWTVVPSGAETWLDVGNALERVDIVLSTAKLNKIIDHVPADLVAVAEAGVTLQKFNTELGKNRQWLPVDPPAGEQSTLGGVVSTGLGGAQQFGYGPPRRHVIGMKVIDAKGRLIKIGGRVVKNVAGYDLCKLFTGSYGTLGVIAEVNFKLRPLPFSSATVAVTGTRAQLIAGGRAVIDAKLFPVAIELLSPAVARETGLSEQEHALLIRFAGSPAAVEHQVSNASRIALGSFAKVITDDERIWHSLAAEQTSVADRITWRITVLPSDIEDCIYQVENHGLDGSLWHAGLGHGRIRVSHNSEPGDKIMQALTELRRHADQFDTSLIIEEAPPGIKLKLGVWNESKQTAQLMTRIKEQLDPCRMFSPGRFSATV
jgi:glycolate oxidase subunit GlcD